ncbi:5'-nucleotidase C-terminal domain-containing protein [Shewanella sp. KX20019]|uniref:bifunctional metallophosphatase/5'-nucleotidase n=1 Tax=Shewanella sp. KX20019 TaxID=2803864 RepID=UPI0019257437|nr:5'-nucleotidase C-terminal domain-containing protein [Shewanella sp. KX20019]QQX79380.1 5'-nucleotidase C-terminal domain-containing protein [Shewanella sp. KX20019]
MKKTTRSVLCLAVLAALAGCNDDETIINTDSGYAPVVTQGKTLTNTPDIIIKSQNEVDEVTITIGATSDLHGRIFGYDYALDAVDSDAGLTRISTLLETAKANNPNMILIDIGDTVQGNSAQLFNDDPTHPVVSTLNSLDFDLWVPGNHEFNFERSFIDRNLNHFNGAVVSNNIKWEENDANYIRAFQVFEVDGAKVAVVGVSPSNIPNWEASAPGHFAGLKFDEELASTRTAVDELIEKHHPDVIIGAFHLGRSAEGGSGVYKIAAEMADKFDVILAGHEHATYIESINKAVEGEEITSTDISIEGGDTAEDKTVSGTYNEANRAQSVKIIEPGKWGWALAQAEIKLKKNSDDKWEMVDTTLSNITSKDIVESPITSSQFQYVHDMSKADAQLVLGLVGGDFTPGTGADEAVHEDFNQEAGRLYSTIHTAKVMDTPLMDFINQIQLEKSAAVVSAASLFSDSSNLIDGQEYAKKDSTNLYKYDNTLIGINMTGANLKRYMEWSYTYFNTYKDGDITVSFTKGAKAYMYDQFDGKIDFVVDLTGDSLTMDENNTVTNEGNRIEIIEIDGKPFDATATYKVALNSYRWGSNIKKFGWATAEDVYYDSVNEPVYAIRDMLTEYVADNKGVNASDFTNPNWEIKQYQDNGAITLLRTDNGAGQALWNRLISKEICVNIDPDNPKYPGILDAVNVNDVSSYSVNPTQDYAGCVTE